LGSNARARAMAARFLMPPLSSEGILYAAAWSPTALSFIWAITSIASRGRSVNSSSTRAMFERIVIEPNNAPLW